MTRTEMQNRINLIRRELEARHKSGVIKLSSDGLPIPSDKLQKEMYALMYKLSKTG